MSVTADHLRAALTLLDFDGLAAQSRMAPASRPMRQLAPDPDMPPALQAAVLILAYPQDDDLHIILTRRQDHLRGHSGQISFPGGRFDEGDEDFTRTALRETCEELGICNTTPLEILGALTKVYIPPSNYDVHPIVALTPRQPHLIPNPDEVAEAFPLPTRHLLNPHTKKTTTREFRGQSFEVPYYDVNGHQVWGATAAMLSELECRLRAIL